MVGKAKGRTVRNKARRVLLIQGHPDYLYKDRVIKSVNVTVHDKTYKLGAISLDFVDDLKKIPDSDVKIFTKTNRITQGIEGFGGLHIRKSNKNTTIEIAAPTEDELQQKIDKLTVHLIEKGLDITERCAWACTVDKKEKIIENSTHSLISKTIIGQTPSKIDDLLGMGDISNEREIVATSAPIKLSDKTAGLQDLAHKMGVGGRITDSKQLNAKSHG